MTAKKMLDLLFYYNAKYGVMVKWYYGVVLKWLNSVVVKWYNGIMVKWYNGGIVKWYEGKYALDGQNKKSLVNARLYFV